MVTGYNFQSLIQSINTELLELKSSAEPLQVEAIVKDLYSKLDGIQGYEFNEQLTAQSFTFYADTDKQSIWQYNLSNMDANTFTFLSKNGEPYYFAGVQTSTTDIVNTLDIVEENYPQSFVTYGTTLYFTVPNTGDTLLQYVKWIEDAQTLTGIKDYFTNNKYVAWYHVKDNPILNITASTVIVNSLTANTFHANTTNDIAEYRIAVENIEPGYVVENIGNKVRLCRKDRSKTAIGIVSDTSNLTLGDKTDSAPIAIAGRVLAYYEGKLQAGDLVCSTKNGKVRKMTFLEKLMHPECIVGKVLNIPVEDEWKNIKINNRAWIQL